VWRDSAYTRDAGLVAIPEDARLSFYDRLAAIAYTPSRRYRFAPKRARTSRHRFSNNGSDRVKLDWRKAGRCWWQEGLRLDFRIRPVGLALSALYALACLAKRQISLDQFHLPAGIRVAALLLTPPRLWPYLVLGEYAYLAHRGGSGTCRAGFYSVSIVVDHAGF
jgi:hypothetical protein